LTVGGFTPPTTVQIDGESYPLSDHTSDPIGSSVATKRATKAAARRGTRLPDGWQPNEELRKFAVELRLDPDEAIAEFKDHWRGVAGAKGLKADWDATFRNSCRRRAERAKIVPFRRGVSDIQEAGDIARRYLGGVAQ
jgi:hypothetical protein